MQKFLLLTLLIAFTFAQIVKQPAGAARYVPEAEQKIDPEEQKKCIQKGGQYQREGLVGRYRCVVTFTDGGKPCSCSRSCQSKLCIVRDRESPKAQCKQNDSPFGCYATIEQFKKNPFIICRD